MVHRGYVPDVLIGEEIVNVVKDTMGISLVDVDITSPALLDASIKSMVIQQLKHGSINKNSIVNQTINVPFSNGNSINFTKLNRNTLLTEDLKRLDSAYTQLSYLSDNSTRSLPSPVPLKVKDDEKIMHSHVLLDDSKKEFLNKAQAVKWKFNEDVSVLAEQYNKNPDAVLEAFGYKPIDANTAVVDIKKIKSVNEKIVRELGELIDAKSVYTNDDNTVDSFFLKWGITKSFRQTIQGIINYQESKIHRQFTHTDAYISTVDTTNKPEVDSIQIDSLSNNVMFELALAQAFKLDPDKNSVRESILNLRKIIDIYGKNKVSVKGDKLSNIQSFITAPELDYSLLKDTALIVCIPSRL